MSWLYLYYDYYQYYNCHYSPVNRDRVKKFPRFLAQSLQLSSSLGLWFYSFSHSCLFCSYSVSSKRFLSSNDSGFDHQRYIIRLIILMCLMCLGLMLEAVSVVLLKFEAFSVETSWCSAEILYPITSSMNS